MSSTPSGSARPWWRSPIDGMIWLGRHELATLVMLMLIAGGVWLFAEIADQVVEGRTHGFDERLLLALRSPTDLSDPIGPAWFEEVMRDFSALGGVGVLVSLTFVVVCFLFLQRKSNAAVLVCAAVLGAWLLSALLKHEYARPRPELVPHSARVYTQSFPSGHSTLSAATYLTLGALVARLQPRRRMKAFAILTAAAVAGVVGASRVYLGVHWPTDVLAGWTIGAAWAMSCWLFARLLQRRGKVEQDVEVDGDRDRRRAE